MITTEIENVRDLMSIALQAEREAINRYSQLAVVMRQVKNISTANLFERMVLEEVEHECLILEWMDKEQISINPDIKKISWSHPDVQGVYNEDACNPYISTPYKALAFAVYNEEIAFRFYSHVAANAIDNEVREQAEMLAREELGHAALLRVERRQAYHAEKQHLSSAPGLDPHSIHNEVDLVAMSVHIDRYIVKQIKAISTSYHDISFLVRKIQQQAIESENYLRRIFFRDKVSPGEQVLSNIEQLAQYDLLLNTLPDAPAPGLQRLFSCCDRSFVFYDAIVEKTLDEKVMLAAQRLSSTALDRIEILKNRFGKCE